MGSSNVLDGRPTPVSDIHSFRDYVLRVRCPACRRTGDLSIEELVTVMRIPRPTPIYRVGERLRCNDCGARGQVLGVVGWRR